jgi:NAD(P)-dependent dehydrogenase (short-subunit alcohol dehydrogenase family)
MSQEAGMQLADRIVVVTGAAGNRGRAVAAEFTARGAKVAGVDLRGDNVVATDLLKQASVDGAIAGIAKKHGRIDVLCNIAGGFRMGPPVHETPDQDWNFLFDVNVRTVLHTSRAVVPYMLKAGGGKIVNIGAFAAQRGIAQMAAYTAAKSAVIRLTEAMAGELREKNINVNCVLPSIIDTPENRNAMPDADPAKWVSPKDLANVIAFLASDEARAIHGAAVPVTGLS